jgi:hypothetical protein
MSKSKLKETRFLIPLRRDGEISDGKHHEVACWQLLDDELAGRFGGRTKSTEQLQGIWKNPKTGALTSDESVQFIVAVPEESLDELRGVLSFACVLFAHSASISVLPGPLSLLSQKMTTTDPSYVDLEGREWLLKSLDPAERRLMAKLRKHLEACQNSSSKPLQIWCDFDNFWLPLVSKYYAPLGVSPKEIIQTPVYKIAQDMSGRLGIALGLVRKPDYRSRLIEIIESQFKTRREFCDATGISEDMLSHVLSGRKDLSIEALANALDRIGYTIRLVPSKPLINNKSA